MKGSHEDLVTYINGGLMGSVLAHLVHNRATMRSLNPEKSDIILILLDVAKTFQAKSEKLSLH